jgi:hypothetical protein
MPDFDANQIDMLAKLFARPPRATGFGKAEKFLLQFVFFEALVRLVGRHYRDRTGQNEKSGMHQSLRVDVVRRSLAHFAIQISDQKIEVLLGSRLKTRMHKSARNLRNGLAHEWKLEDVQEVDDRYEALSHDLVEAIGAIEASLSRHLKDLDQ